MVRKFWVALTVFGLLALGGVLWNLTRGPSSSARARSTGSSTPSPEVATEQLPTAISDAGPLWQAYITDALKVMEPTLGSLTLTHADPESEVAVPFAQEPYIGITQTINEINAFATTSDNTFQMTFAMTGSTGFTLAVSCPAFHTSGNASSAPQICTQYEYRFGSLAPKSASSVTKSPITASFATGIG
jgi:hypothetical protein